MAVIVDWQGKPILDSSNGVFSGLYDSMINFIEENNINLNETMENLIKELESGCRGIGLDIADYIHKKEDLETLIYLVRKGLDKFYEDIPRLPATTTERLNNLYQELLKAQETFPD